MVHRVATKALILCATCALVTNQVRIGAAYTCRASSLMRINHYFIVGGLGYAIQVVIIHPLAIVMFTAWNDVAHIATLNCGVTIVNHKLVSLVKMALIVTGRTRCFVVHNHFHTLRGSIFMNCLDIKIRVRRDKVKHIVLFMSEPIFPTNVPTLNKYRVKTIFCSKVNVALHIFGISRVCTVRLGMCIVGFAQFYGREVIGVSPSSLVGNHVPPNANILGRLYP